MPRTRTVQFSPLICSTAVLTFFVICKNYTISSSNERLESHLPKRSPQSWRTMPSSTIFFLPFFRLIAAISDICQIEEAFVNFIEGVSGGEPSMSRRAYSIRIDKFVRDIKASFRSLGHSVVKFECELTQFRFLQKPKLNAYTNHSPEKCSTACFTQHDRVILNQIHKASVFGEMPTDSQVAGNIRRQQIIYGVKLYRPSSGKSKGFSSLKAADCAISAPQFKDAQGAYKATERQTLAKEIRRKQMSI